MGATEIRPGTILCELLSIADIYPKAGNPARASIWPVSGLSKPALDCVTADITNWSPSLGSPPSLFLCGECHPSRLQRLAAARASQLRRYFYGVTVQIVEKVIADRFQRHPTNRPFAAPFQDTRTVEGGANWFPADEVCSGCFAIAEETSWRGSHSLQQHASRHCFSFWNAHSFEKYAPRRRNDALTERTIQ